MCFFHRSQTKKIWKQIIFFENKVAAPQSIKWLASYNCRAIDTQDVDDNRNAAP